MVTFENDVIYGKDGKPKRTRYRRDPMLKGLHESLSKIDGVIEVHPVIESEIKVRKRRRIQNRAESVRLERTKRKVRMQHKKSAVDNKLSSRIDRSLESERRKSEYDRRVRVRTSRW